MFSETEPQEDLLLSRLDGSERRALTNDAYRDRRPRFSPDGQRIAFYSDRGGNYEVWTIARAGGDLRPLTHDRERRNARHPAWSPDGSRIFFSRTGGVTGEIVPADGEPGAPALYTLPPFVDPAFSFVGIDWSPDGGKIAGQLVSAAGERGGVAVYDLALGRYTTLTDFGIFPAWLPDSRRLVFVGSASNRAVERDYSRGDSLLIVDRVTRRVSEVVSLPEASVGYPSVSRDGRWLVFVRTLVKADVWTLTSGTPRPKQAETP